MQGLAEKPRRLLNQTQLTGQGGVMSEPFGLIREMASSVGAIHQQISGSLQPRVAQSPHIGFPVGDPYDTSLDFSRVVLFNIVTSAPDQKNVAQVLHDFGTYARSRIATHKVLASFTGRVEAMTDQAANVVLKNDTNGEIIESRCDSEALKENGISIGDEFICEVIRANGETTARLSRLSPKSISKVQVAQFRNAF